MPEIAEGAPISPALDLHTLYWFISTVARIVYHLRKNLAGKILKVVKAQDDTIIFGKVGTSGAEFQKALTGKKVLDAGQQGKYFWYDELQLLRWFTVLTS